MEIGKTKIAFIDLCLGDRFFATVSVTDVEDILVVAPDYVSYLSIIISTLHRLHSVIALFCAYEFSKYLFLTLF